MTGSITAIVPTYNRADFLREALRSLLGQRRPVAEVIVWDDGSTDATEAVVREAGEAAKHGPPIRYFRSANGGKARALNRALAEAQGDYIWICDDDDLALPGATEALAGELDARPRLIAAGGGYRRFRSDAGTGERIETGPGYWPDLSQGSVLRHLLEDVFLFQNATLVRQAGYRAAGPFREDLPRSIDYDMIVRLAARGEISVQEQPMFLQRKHEGIRGPESARHAAARSEEVWKTIDRQVFSALRHALPLELYDAMFESGDAHLVRRAALVQRACVYARRTDWTSALHDLRAAAAVAPGTALTPAEQDICRRAMSGKHGCAEALAPAVRQALADLAQGSPCGAGIARALVRGIAWRGRVALQAGRLREATAIARFAAALLRAAARQGSGNPPAALRERDALPRSAWLPPA